MISPDRHPLASLLLAAFALRAAVALILQNALAPDEVFQFIEQAHRLIYGGGLIPWEFQVGLRNWSIPLLLAAPMALAHLLDPAPAAGLILVRLILCAASLSIVWAAARWGLDQFGPRGLWIAGGLAAIWPDLVLMAPHPLEESLAAYALVPAIYLIDRRDPTARQIAAAALLLGLAFTFRVQLAPAIALAGLLLCRADIKRWRIAIPLAALPVIAAGLLDWWSWGQPFRSFWLNIYINVILHVAKTVFGNDGPSFFPLALIFDWSWTFPFLALLVWRGARLRPVPAIIGGAILLTHLLIAHKEFRFIFPALALLLPVAGIGLAALLGPRPSLRSGLVAGIWLAGAFCSPLTCMLAGYQTHAHKLFAGLATTHPCVVSLQNWDKKFLPLPQLFTAQTRFTDATFAPDGVEADAIVGSQGAVSIPAGFALRGCVPGNWRPFMTAAPPPTCAWTRPIASCPTGPVAPFQIIFPAAARPFIIRDRFDP